MSVRQSLLAILDQGACYGYQLRAEFDRRTGGTSPLNVGQIYNTLERLERDSLVAKGDTDAHGHVFYAITDAGRTEARDWLAAPVARATGDAHSAAASAATATRAVKSSRGCSSRMRSSSRPRPRCAGSTTWKADSRSILPARSNSPSRPNRRDADGRRRPQRSPDRPRRTPRGAPRTRP